MSSKTIVALVMTSVVMIMSFDVDIIVFVLMSFSDDNKMISDL